MNLEVLNDPAAALADRLVAAAERGGHIALTGGSTPREAYARAAAAGADWSRAVLWFGDERCVGPDDDRSNYRMARETLLDGIDVRAERILGELGPEEGAADYERRLAGAVEAGGDGMPVLDLVLLGLGPDGHCASLFPSRPEVGVRDRAVVGVPEAGLEPFVPRVSMTLPTLNAAREVWFVVTGAGKADAAERAFGGDPREDTPASLVRPPRLTVLMDPPAASRLRP
jgi:6-phosphogluconolactonase